MATKIATYLQTHLQGEVIASPAVRTHFSFDSSVLQITPQVVVYPRSTNDVRKAVRFAWQLAEKGHVLPITPRGFGTDTTGASLGAGAILSFPSHMGQILELDTKQKLVRVQPGIEVSSLQETLHTHGLCFSPLPSRMPHTTIGGALANGAASHLSGAKGFMHHWVDKLEVVLPDGEVIQTGKISKRELEKKKGLPTLEGDLYRAVDGITADNQEAIAAYDDKMYVVRNDNAGYRFVGLFDKSGAVDLTPLFVGSQGTLGVITEVILKLQEYEPQTSYAVAVYDSLDQAVAATERCTSNEIISVELFSKQLIKEVNKLRGNSVIKAIFEEPLEGYIVIVESRGGKKHRIKSGIKATAKRLSSDAKGLRILKPDEHETVEQLRAYKNAHVLYDTAGKSALPIINGAMVPEKSLSEFLPKVEAVMKKHHVEEGWTCDALSGELTIMPQLDVSKVGGRQKIIALMNDYFNLVWSVGGTVAGSDSDGRMKALYTDKQLGEQLVAANRELKKAVDPHAIMNPGVKVNVDSKRLVSLLRKDYSIAHRSDVI